MKKLIGILLVFFTIISCSNQKIYSDYDYSFSRSGGKDPIYENLLIKGNNGYYSLEGQGKKIKKNFTISNDEIQVLNQTLKNNHFRYILEDHKKLYDNVSVAINVKKGENSGSKNDGSLIAPKDKKYWDAVVLSFQDIINKNIKS